MPETALQSPLLLRSLLPCVLLQSSLFVGTCAAGAPTAASPVPVTQQIVELTALGHDQYEERDLHASRASFARAVELGETRLDASAIELFEPLRGLAQVLFATQQYAAADATLRRAINIVRRDGGLYDPRQLTALATLAESQAITGQLGDAAGSLSYLERISSNTFGVRSVRHAVMLTQIGRSYCRLGNAIEGRQRFRSAVELLEMPTATDIQRIAALRGIAECCMYEVAAYGISTAPRSLDDFHGQMNGPGNITPANPTFRNNVLKLLRFEGEQGLKRAARLALRSNSIPLDLRIGVLLQTGDWFQIKDHVRAARDYYVQAHRLSTAAAGAQATNPDGASPDRGLWEPVQLLYATPPHALRQRGNVPAPGTERYVVVEFTVRSDGRVQDEKVVDRDASKSMVDETMLALRTARYRPRFVEGKPAHTQLVQYRQTFVELK